MRRIPGQLWVAFLSVLGIVLTIVFLLFQSAVDFRSIPTKHVVLNSLFAILISVGTTVLLVVAFLALGAVVSKAWRRLFVTITLYTLDRAVSSHARAVQAIGIGEQRASVVVRLGMGSSESVTIGDKFGAVNAATREKLGVLEVIEVEGDSCLSSVSDRINVEFWDDLEGRMQRDPSPPSGVTFSREVPEGLLEFVHRLIRGWGG